MNANLSLIAPAELNAKTERGEAVTLIDVRTPLEYRHVHVPFAENLPLDELDSLTESRRAQWAGKPVYVICQSGSRAKTACERLRQAGIQAISVEGGTKGWTDAGLAVKRGRGVISLDRQVRIGAGSLVLLGVGLGTMVHPGFLGIAAFVGAGLVFAGVTDTCGMAMLLARMPWNQLPKSGGPKNTLTCAAA